MKKTYYITYRNEFEAEVVASSREEAISKFENNEAKITCCGDLWEEFMKVLSEDEV